MLNWWCVQDGATVNCFDWLSFGGTQYKTTGFKNIDQSDAGFECNDKTDCCKYTPKAGPALFWVDRAPYDDFTGTDLDAYIPNRYSQHRMKYQAKPCASRCVYQRALFGPQVGVAAL